MKIKLFFAMLATLPMYVNVDSVIAVQDIKGKESLNDKSAANIVLKYLADENAKIPVETDRHLTENEELQKKNYRQRQNIANFVKATKTTGSAVADSHFNHYPLITIQDLENYPDLEEIVLYDLYGNSLMIAAFAVAQGKVKKITVAKPLTWPSYEFDTIRCFTDGVKDLKLEFTNCVADRQWSKIDFPEELIWKNLKYDMQGVTEIKEIDRKCLWILDSPFIIPDSVKIIRYGAFRNIDYELVHRQCTVPGTVKEIGGLVFKNGVAPDATSLTLNFDNKDSTSFEGLLTNLLLNDRSHMKRMCIPEGVCEITEDFGKLFYKVLPGSEYDICLPATLEKLSKNAFPEYDDADWTIIHASKDLPKDVLNVLRRLSPRCYKVVFDSEK